MEGVASQGQAVILDTLRRNSKQNPHPTKKGKRGGPLEKAVTDYGERTARSTTKYTQESWAEEIAHLYHHSHSRVPLALPFDRTTNARTVSRSQK